MRVTGVIQARMGSSRLPGKIMIPLIRNEPLLGVQAIRACVPDVDWWIATTREPEDDETTQWAIDRGFFVYRGDVNDVLSRFIAVAGLTEADWLLRLTGDNPFTEARMVRRLIAAAETAGPGVDLVRDPFDARWFPMGFVPEIVRVTRLRSLSATPGLASYHRIHVTSAIPADQIQAIDPGVLPARPDLRWTIDTAEDLAMARRLLEVLVASWQTASYEDLLACIDGHPDIAEINQHVSQKRVEEG